ncbi:MAG TPA: RdgB/HAM1 family non-canonical purine NTP pyrophosphatase [Planctomycetaceae bacterium]|nr:RdgB/HAM1 family non-canonical purine NTP pyrophosphatase [Planctomycetaceae bacterium]
MLVLASRNRKKSDEIRALLAPHGVEVVSVAAFPGVPDVVEDGATFAENAAKKAREVAIRVGRWTLAEDSGLRVDALGGAPGVYSARYAGEPSDDLQNNLKLVSELAGVPPERRTARYVCHVALADPAGEIRLSEEATCRGRIVDEPRGRHGFGYDPHFLIPEYHRTFGELGPVVKNQISHRARAFERAVPKLVRLLGSRAAGDGGSPQLHPPGMASAGSSGV